MEGEIAGEELGYRYIYIPSRTGRAPTLLLLHGMGGSERDLIPLARAVSPESPVLSLRGKVVENGLRRFFRRIGEGVYDVEDLHYRSNEIADLIDIASRKHGFDRGRIIAIGYSNGANMSVAIALIRPGALYGAVLIRPLFPLDIGRERLAGTPILILAGRRDRIAPPQESIKLAERLKRKGASVELHILDAGHEITDSDIDLIRRWIERVGYDRSRESGMDIAGLSGII